MDADGIASEVIFHGAGHNDVPMPFISSDDRDLEALGKRIYNRWLADFCAVTVSACWQWPNCHGGH